MSTTTVVTQPSIQLEANIGRAQSTSDTVSNRTYAPVYSRFSNVQKGSMTAFIAFGGLNAVYLVFVGLSCCFWGPWADVFGRKSAYVGSTTLFLVFSIGTALSRNLVAFFVFRALTACQVTALLIVGPSCISDIYHPVQRGTSLGWFACGCMLGPAFGPLLSGIIVTYTSWRVIFWLQAGLAGFGLLQAIFVLHETLQQLRYKELRGKGFRHGLANLWKWSNPWTVFKLFGQKNLLCVNLASASTAWNMYSLLTPIRFVLNPRLNLTTPLQSGLLYLIPGAGYLIGTQVGGRLVDHVVKSWIKRRGFRLQEDRLRGCILTLGILLPGSTLFYGWSVDRNFGGVALPGICMFVQGFAQMCAFPSLNAYILDVMQHKSGKASGAYSSRDFPFRILLILDSQLFSHAVLLLRRRHCVLLTLD
ncbi:Major facilitator superfamily transporter [Fusarium albosuccineum]|uniref:Major facilitator superfamily transporter n=1 Tax=Fusarium albosuccineum TaxID=1237068 RepID=A0A8H4PFE2_9HYPO|nr:Major facilitator superfamily transporter [Fusarium albosuccineum]